MAFERPPYLTHGFVPLFVGIAWRKVFHGHYLPLYALVNIALALKLGLTEKVTSPVPSADDQAVKTPRKRRRMPIF